MLGAPPGMQKLIVNAEQDRAVLRAGGKHGSAAAMQNLLLTSFASQQSHTDALLLQEVWWCWRDRGELCFMPHSAANACVTTGKWLARSAKTAADPHLELQCSVLLGNGLWKRQLGVPSPGMSENVVSFL